MSDSNEMRRLILHAASRLKDEIDDASATGTGTRGALAAMALAEGTLRMVAACMVTDEPAVQPPRVRHAERGAGGRFAPKERTT